MRLCVNTSTEHCRGKRERGREERRVRKRKIEKVWRGRAEKETGGRFSWINGEISEEPCSVWKVSVCVCLHHAGASVGLFPPDFLRQRKVELHLPPMCVESNLCPSSFHRTISFLMCFSLVKGTLLFLSLIISFFFCLTRSGSLTLILPLLFFSSSFYLFAFWSLWLPGSLWFMFDFSRNKKRHYWNELILAVWYVCVCVSERVLDTVTAGRAAVAGLLSCRAGPCVGGNRTDQLKWDKGGTGFLFNRQPHFAFCHFSHTHTVISRLYNSILDAQCMTVYDSSKQWLHRQPCISDEVMKLSGPDMMCETKVFASTAF